MANNVISISDNHKTQKPSSSAFKQQKLPSWSPILTVGTVLPTFFLIGVAFIPIGIGRDVYLYYGLTNFYQNHRRYVKSRDDRQLLGESKGSTECDPYAQIGGNWIAPCGAIANSLFNDTFLLKRDLEDGREPKSVPVIKTGIAWATDKNAKFRNPPIPEGQNLSDVFKGTVQPPNWRKKIYELDNKLDNNGYVNEGFIVWMRTSALPTFRKLYARIAHDKQDSTEARYYNSLPKGKYILIITYNYPVAAFKGTKRFIISNTSWLGGKNPFIAVMYIIVGFVCLLLSGVFVIIHKKFGKSTTEILNISQRTPYIG